MKLHNQQTNRVKALTCAAVVFCSLLGSAAIACSTAVLGLRDRPIVAYSYDFAPTGDGFIYVNPAMVGRQSIMPGNPATWTATYGSVTFSQMGPGMPAAGMNTAGLAVTLMWNEKVVFGGSGQAPIVNDLELIQRMLDTSDTVEQALSTLTEVDVHGLVPIHYLISDRHGTAAAVAPSPGGFQTHTGNDMPYRALTNTGYAELVSQVSIYDGFGGSVPVFVDRNGREPSSLERFAVLASFAQVPGSQIDRMQALDLLNDVLNSETRWQIVFDHEERKIEFRIVGTPGTFHIDFSDLDFQCQERPLSADLSTLSAAQPSPAFEPADPDRVSDVSRDVLSAIPNASGIGPEVAAELTHGLLQAVRCGG